MRTFKLLAVTITCSVLSITSFTSHAMDKYIESALIDVCKTSLKNNVVKFNKTVSSYNLPTKKVALKVMCNGDDIITFAEKHGAIKTAAQLERSIKHNVNIIDVAKVEKINVNFEL